MFNLSKSLFLTLSLGLMSVTLAYADETADDASGKKAVSETAIAERWGLDSDKVRPSAIPGLLEIMIGSQVVYMSDDGRFLVEGDIVDLETQVNLTEKRRNIARKNTIGSLGEEKMILFGPDHPLHTITVFTDTDCTYCRKLHSEIGLLNELGVEVRYLLYPRYGPGSESWHIANNVWCSDDRHNALTRAKLGEAIEPSQCDTPVQEIYTLGQGIGFRGTPAIVTSNGDLIAGYLPPKSLLNRLDQLAKNHTVQ
jgi:thiol:disulfide interchange protein DsbC